VKELGAREAAELRAAAGGHNASPCNSGELIVKSKAGGVQLTRAAEKALTGQARTAHGDCVAEPDLSAVSALQRPVTSPAEWERMKRALGGEAP